MNAAIIGATGLIGQHLLQKLIDSGQYENILVLGRKQPHYNNALATQVSFISCSLSELQQLALPFTIDHAFCCLGTTIKKAGSQDAFIAVDKTACIDFIAKCQANCNYVVTALGANSQSKTFYNRVKGETQEALAEIITHSQQPRLTKRLWLFQPSLLLGKRSEARLLEDMGKQLFRLISPLFIGALKQYRPIEADKVANAMLAHALAVQAEPVQAENASQSTQLVTLVSNNEML
ncbi:MULTISPECIES: NAD-dependent epimerase/dehydratase family protein [unclassified Shewanella]|uniref:NAD-dependent epimerase/dehydratase family protein n=1 Tax=unclassified Shewanella TaxID=196818 RepID=UPI001BBEC6B5|nr:MULTISPECIES: NAD-dependent epimerase/dehydratase family protein [unclassified Shewanella]GIU19701.1 oxidoreductase [Shewanella sp. MBTL60-112-B1]GIU27651.1 oxidoreductase [Shewanella sp. MBTL60-112-B2]